MKNGTNGTKCIFYRLVLNRTANETFIIDLHKNRSATLPPELQFTKQSWPVIIIYCITFVIAAIGNLTVFVTLCRERYRKSRISLMICHLSAADLLVTFIMIPVEVMKKSIIKIKN